MYSFISLIAWASGNFEYETRDSYSISEQAWLHEHSCKLTLPNNVKSTYLTKNTFYDEMNPRVVVESIHETYFKNKKRKKKTCAMYWR